MENTYKEKEQKYMLAAVIVRNGIPLSVFVDTENEAIKIAGAQNTVNAISAKFKDIEEKQKKSGITGKFNNIELPVSAGVIYYTIDQVEDRLKVLEARSFDKSAEHFKRAKKMIVDKQIPAASKSPNRPFKAAPPRTS